MYILFLIICVLPSCLLTLHIQRDHHSGQKVVANVVQDMIHPWTQYTTKYEKIYDSVEEAERRRLIFLLNYNQIKMHNRKYSNGESTYKMDLNQFSDLTHDEYITHFGFLYPKEVQDRKVREIPSRRERSLLSSIIPTSIDWRDHGVLSPVKNQASCAACWAFAPAASIEAANAIKNKELVELNIQYIVDCASAKPYQSNGCVNGLPDDTFKMAATNGLVAADGYSQFTGELGQCREPNATRSIKIEGYTFVPKIESSMIKNVANNPVMAGIDASSFGFRHYAEGILDDDECSSETINHAVLIVGYDSNAWIVQNSWGTSWGQDGFIRIVRRKNMCGINENVMVPLI